MLKKLVIQLARTLSRGNDRRLNQSADSPHAAAKGPFGTGLPLGCGAALVAAAVLLPTEAVRAEFGFGFNRPGNVLIADQFNNRVIETDPEGNIVWSFGRGPNDFSPRSIIGCNDAERVGIFTLMAGTGTQPGVIPQATNGAVDNRVLLVDPFARIVWQYGQFGKTGSARDLLNTPVQNTFLPNTDILITDQGNNRIIEVSLAKQIVWQYPGPNTNASDQLASPNSAELLENGHILIADQGNNRAIEVSRAQQILKTFSAGGTVSILAFASRLPDGDTLITDSGNARIVEVDSNDVPVWQYLTVSLSGLKDRRNVPTRSSGRKA